MKTTYSRPVATPEGDGDHERQIEFNASKDRYNQRKNELHADQCCRFVEGIVKHGG